MSVTIGRVVSIRGSVVWGALFDDDDGTAARAARMGALVSMRGPDSRVFGIVNALKRDGAGGGPQSERTIFEIQVLGEISTVSPGARAAGFQRGVSSYPPLDAPVTTVTLRDLAAVYARPRVSNVHVGRLRHNHKVPAFVLTDSLLGKHFAVLGTTGSGKSCAVSVILRSILDELPHGHIVLLDPHNEYAGAFADRAELLNPSNLQLPYWLLNFEEIGHILIGGTANEHSFAQTAILKDAILRAKRAFLGEPGRRRPGHHRHADAVPPVGSDRRPQGRHGHAQQGRRLRRLSEPDRPHRGPAQRSPLRLHVREPRGARHDAADPRAIAAHPGRRASRSPSSTSRACPRRSSTWWCRCCSGWCSSSPCGATAAPRRRCCWCARRPIATCREENLSGFAPTKRVISRIAKEGRKYGVTLCLVSQRPSELSIGSLSQCNTVFALRLTNEHDQAFVARALPENARWLVDSLPSLNTQEAVVVGDGVTVPVHIRFNDLDKDHLPSGRSPSFAASWRDDTDPQFLDHAIDRWRQQTR